MSNTVRKKWNWSKEPPEAPGAAWEAFLDAEHRDRGCRAGCETCGKGEARRERRRTRHSKRRDIDERMQ